MLTINNKIGFMNFRSYSKALRMPRVFPANAGMNRTTMNSPLRARSVPRNAGMNRGLWRPVNRSTSVPRKRGDEPPTTIHNPFMIWCSPQTRG